MINSQADRLADLINAGDAACADGAVSLRQWGAALTAADKKLLGRERIEAWKERVRQTEEVF